MCQCTISCVRVLAQLLFAFQFTMDDVGSWIVKAVILAIFAQTLAVVYRDARLRGKDPLTVAVLCALCGWPASIILWFVFRPEDPSPPSEAVECIQCQSTIPAGQTVCPKC